MNRQQRRMAQKKGLPVAHEPVFNMKQSDIKKIKQEASEKAVNTAMILLLGIPVKSPERTIWMGHEEKTS